MILKIFRKPAMNVQYTGGNRPKRVKESWNTNLVWLSEQFLEVISVFKDASRNLYLFFSTTRKAKTIIIISNGHVHAALILYFIGFQKHIHLVTQSLPVLS